MERSESDAASSRPTQTEFVNYLPAMPGLPSETSALERLFTAVFRQRGRFVPVEGSRNGRSR